MAFLQQKYQKDLAEEARRIALIKRQKEELIQLEVFLHEDEDLYDQNRSQRILEKKQEQKLRIDSLN